jgi:deoxyadenosine/deoxycytidine kinase
MKRIISIEGEIGSGKSTLLELLKAQVENLGYKVCIIPEPVDKWRESGALRRLYADPKHEAYPFQTFAYVTRIRACQEAVARCPDADFYFLERTIYTDRYVFMETLKVNMDPDIMKMYDAWWDLHSQLLPFDLSKASFIYLKPDISVCMERVLKRAREEEIGVATTVTSLIPVNSISNPSTESVKPKKGDIAKGGVAPEYQVLLRQHHERFFEAVEYPGRPFPNSSVHIITGELANENFTQEQSSGAGYKKIADHILGLLELNGAAE